jgi:DNA polymerase I-like protein with 3'-5' exonuclease and polymerase domains
MSRYIVDIETDGLLWELTRIHCLVLRDIDSGEVISATDDHADYVTVDTALNLLSNADEISGHNIIKFDLPAIKKVCPDFQLKNSCKISDTLVISRLLWPEIKEIDYARWAHIPPKYIGRHSLAAWGERLGVEKIKFKEEQKSNEVIDVWAEWSESMQKYCEQDTLVSYKLYLYMEEQNIDQRAYKLEHEFCHIMAKQEAFGFDFNYNEAVVLVDKLKEKRNALEQQLQALFPPVEEERWSEKTGRKLKTKVTIFNPGSRLQTAQRLQEKYPEIKFDSTEKGSPKVDDNVLEKLGETYPEAKQLAEYQLYNKRIGQISDGKEGWLKHYQKYGDGRIHGEIVTNACVSGRCAHRHPNMSQVPSVGSLYGPECRALFVAPDGWKLIGTDASALELRALGAWLAHFDGGEYAKLVSTEGFDIHSYNAKLFGIWDGESEIEKSQRNLSKSCIFAVCYGAGARKVGSLFYAKGSETQMMKKGKEVIDTFYQRLPAIKKLKDKIAERIVSKGYLVGIDGRHLQIRSPHSALNQLLQSTGAVLMKKATCILYDDMNSLDLIHDKDYAFCGFYHDEWQLAVKPEHVNILQSTSINAIKKSGEYFNLLCPFTGESRVGLNWMETH